EHRRKSSLTPIRAQTATVSQAHTLIFDMGIWVETGKYQVTYMAAS
ncbi:hypothetical protein Tco_0483194, partial [Tanacetum coccineum]